MAHVSHRDTSMLVAGIAVPLILPMAQIPNVCRSLKLLKCLEACRMKNLARNLLTLPKLQQVHWPIDRVVAWLPRSSRHIPARGHLNSLLSL